MHITQVMDGVYLHVRTCRCAPFPYLGNGRMDCAEIWCVVRDSLAKRFTKAYGRVHLHVRTCAPADVPLFRILENGWTDCAEIWYVVRDPLARLFAKVNDGAQLHVRTFFRITETAGRIALTFGMWLETH